MDKAQALAAKVIPGGPGIELYSAKFYGACTLGGLLACVSPLPKKKNFPSPPLTDTNRV